MRCDDNSLGIIDFQDAVSGPITYDLVSWIWDRYISWPDHLIEKWLMQARDSYGGARSAEEWIADCRIVALQRNLKILGIFCRLHYRDNKSHYLELLPRFSSYVSSLISALPVQKKLAQPVISRLEQLD